MLLAPGVLRVGAAFPDPPFEVPGPPAQGLDVELVQAVAAELDLRWELHRYRGADFDGIFAGLDDGRYDVVASGATITEHRAGLARFCQPYLRSGQSLVVNPSIHPEATGVDELGGLVVGVQHGNTSEPVVRALHAHGKIAAVRVYAYDEILRALADVADGTIAAFMKLEPVMRHLVADRPELAVVQTGITSELLAVAVARPNAELATAIDGAQSRLHDRGTLRDLTARWLAGSDPGATQVLL